MTLGPVLADAARRLAAVSETPRLDAELLMAHALGEPREAMLLGARDRPVPPGFAPLLTRRLAREPVAYLVGRRDFWTITLRVTPAVLIPRPDSETLIEAALAHFGRVGPRRVLDLGTGSGALLLAALAEWPEATGLGIDRSEAALAVAADNAVALGMGDRAAFAHAGWEAGAAGDYDLVLCNPPYIGIDEPLPPEVRDHEPASALFAGADGLDDYRAIAAQLHLPPGGAACIEIGATQAAAVSALFAARGFRTVLRQDLAGRYRCLVATPDA
ncbi:peptide chain release factor N(5)-glutamine methyltransferase [Sphingomonas sp.]|uniref:peptide chain release factor N(5)-glutamine methyltransferase n=1 Tax=Sphingomonas sp. TaxID=28214 RepID=UPI003B3BB682